jgi:hypothetical protein
MIPLALLPHGHTLVAAKASFYPSAEVRAGASPDILPSICVAKYSDVGVETILGTTTHVWSDEATYEAGFTLTVAGLTEIIDMSDTSYFVKLVGEHGANAFSGLLIKSLHVSCTIDHAYGGADLSLWI